MDFLTHDVLTSPVWMWAAILALATVLLGPHPGVLCKKQRRIRAAGL